MLQVQSDGLPPDFGFWLALALVAGVIVAIGAYLFFQRQQERSRARVLRRSTERIAAQARAAFADALLTRGYTAVCPDDVIVRPGLDGEFCCKAVAIRDSTRTVLYGDFYAGLGLHFEREWYFR